MEPKPPRVFFEPEGLSVLQRVYRDAVAEVGRFQPVTPEMADVIAARIFSVAAKGYHSEIYMLQTAIEGYLPKKFEIEDGSSIVQPESAAAKKP